MRRPAGSRLRTALVLAVLSGACLGPLAVPAGAQSNGEDPGGWKAAGRSLLVPGWGQRTQGRTGLADVLTGIEAAGWLGVWGWSSYEAWRRDDSRRWAAARAAADIAGKDGRWFEALEDFPDLVTWNAFQRSGLGDPALAYPEGAGWEWRWESEAAWRRYRDLRRLSRVAKNLTRVAIGGIVAVRLTGAVAALITARSEVGEGGTGPMPAAAARPAVVPWWTSTSDGVAAGILIRW